MKRYRLIIPWIIALVLQSCTGDNLEQRISSLEERISALESVYGEINDNATEHSLQGESSDTSI